MKRKLSFIILLIGALVPIYGAKAKTKKAQDPQEVLQRGREAFYNYNFDEAADLYEEYRTLKTKAKQPLDEELEIWENELEIATNAFERVQKIIVVDSLSFPEEVFFESYRLSPSAGKIVPASSVGLENGSREAAYMNEAEDYIIYPKKNKEGELNLYESNILLDGTREEIESVQAYTEKSGDYAYPFMSADGQTLYFANNGEESMGGYDIFIAQKDPFSGEYRQPLNLGMPFNSPFDDFMFAVDEESGLGWWATNRNSLDGQVTVYIFLYDDIRKNYPSDTENLEEYAKLTSYRSTWQDGKKEDIQPLLSKISSSSKKEGIKKDFMFSLGDGRVYTKISDFKNRRAADLMKQYQTMTHEFLDKENALNSMRVRYKSDKSSQTKLKKMESEVETLRSQLSDLRNEIIRIEKTGK